MLKDDKVDPEQIRSSLFLCVRSVRYMTEQLVTIVASLNEGTNEMYRPKYNKNYESHNFPNALEMEKTSCEDLTSESIYSIRETNSADITSKYRNSLPKYFNRKGSQRNNVNHSSFETSEERRQESLVNKNHLFTRKSYSNTKPIEKTKTVYDAKTIDPFIHASSQTFKTNTEDKQSFTTPDKCTQTQNERSLNEKSSSLVKQSKSNVDKRKPGIYTTQTVQTDPLVQMSDFNCKIPSFENIQELKDVSFKRDVFRRTTLKFENSNNEINWSRKREVCPDKHNSINQTKEKTDQESKPIESENCNDVDKSKVVNLSFNSKRENAHNRSVSEEIKINNPQLNVEREMSFRENRKDSILSEKSLPKTFNFNEILEGKKSRNCSSVIIDKGEPIVEQKRKIIKLIKPIKRPKVSEENSIIFGYSTSNINTEVDYQNSNTLLENDKVSFNGHSNEEEQVSDLSFYDEISNVNDNEYLNLDDSVSEDLENVDSFSNISMYNSQFTSYNNSDLLHLSMFDDEDTHSDITSPSLSSVELSSDISAFSKSELSDKFVIKNDFLQNSFSNIADQNFLKSECIHSSDQSGFNRNYLIRMKSGSSLSCASHTNNIKYKTINTTNCDRRFHKRQLENFNNINYFVSSHNEYSSMKDISTLSVETLSNGTTKMKDISNHVTQIFVEKSESKVDLEILISKNRKEPKSSISNSLSCETFMKPLAILDGNNFCSKNLRSNKTYLPNIENAENESTFKSRTMTIKTRDCKENNNRKVLNNNPYTSCIENQSNISDTSTVIKKSHQQSLDQSSKNESLLYEVFIVDFENLSSKGQFNSSSKTCHPCLIKSFENTSSLNNSKAETVFLQATLEMGHGSSKINNSKNFKIRIDPKNTYLEESKSHNSELTSQTRNDLFSCFDDSYNFKTQTEYLSSPKIKNRKQKRNRKSKGKFYKEKVYISSRNMNCPLVNGSLKNVNSKFKAQTIIECFLENL